MELSEFMEDIKLNVINQLESILKRFQSLKVNTELAGLYFLSTQERTNVKTFLTRNEVVTIGTNLDDYQDLATILDRNTQEFTKRNAGMLTMFQK